MRKRELLEQLADYAPEDIIGIGVAAQGGGYISTAISSIARGDGIALLCTPDGERYKVVTA